MYNKMLRQGIYNVKEVFVRDVEMEEVPYSVGASIQPVFIEDKGGNFVQGFKKEYTLQRERIGELVAYREEGTEKIHIGYSCCHPNDMRQYSKETGLNLALCIADVSWDDNFAPKIPGKALESVAYFADRCQRYWQGSKVPAWAQFLIDTYVCRED